MARTPATSATDPGVLEQRFAEIHGDAERIAIARAPGRVNLLGDHTDYNDGFVLPMTIDRAVGYALRRRDGGMIRLRSLNLDQDLRYQLDAPPSVTPGDWTSYVVGVIEELRGRGLVASGFEGVLAGDVPLGGGLSSSAALEVATVVALQRLLGFELDPVEAAKLCQRVEHRYAGVQCGIMDQFASRLGRSGHALFLDCRTLVHEHVPFALDEVSVVIVDSGRKRELAGSKYNERRAECEAGVAHFQRFEASVRALRDVTPELLARREGGLAEPVRRRCRHVVFENRRVLDAITALRRREFGRFGQLMNESHASLRDDYEVSSPELDLLVEIGQATEGVLGARMTGAGFGGCTVHMVEKPAVACFEARIRELYPARFALEPAVYVLAENLEAG